MQLPHSHRFLHLSAALGPHSTGSREEKPSYGIPRPRGKEGSIILFRGPRPQIGCRIQVLMQSCTLTLRVPTLIALVRVLGVARPSRGNMQTLKLSCPSVKEIGRRQETSPCHPCDVHGEEEQTTTHILEVSIFLLALLLGILEFHTPSTLRPILLGIPSAAESTPALPCKLWQDRTAQVSTEHALANTEPAGTQRVYASVRAPFQPNLAGELPKGITLTLLDQGEDLRACRIVLQHGCF